MPWLFGESEFLKQVPYLFFINALLTVAFSCRTSPLQDYLLSSS
jgi:hypothetical protein